MGKFGYFMAAMTTAAFGLAATWYIKRTQDQNKKAKTGAGPNIFDSTDVDTGLCSKLARMVGNGGKFSSIDLSQAKTKMTGGKILEKLAGQGLKNKYVAEAKELRKTIKAPEPDVVVLDLNQSMDNEEFLNNLPPEVQEQILLQHFKDIFGMSEESAAAAY